MKIMTPMGCVTGLGVIFPRGLVWGVLPTWLFQNFKMALGVNFVFNYWLNI